MAPGLDHDPAPAAATDSIIDPGQAADSTAGISSPDRYPKADFLLIKYENL